MSKVSETKPQTVSKTDVLKKERSNCSTLEAFLSLHCLGTQSNAWNSSRLLLIQKESPNSIKISLLIWSIAWVNKEKNLSWLNIQSCRFSENVCWMSLPSSVSSVRFRRQKCMWWIFLLPLIPWTCCTTHSSTPSSHYISRGLKSDLWCLCLQSHSLCNFRGNVGFWIVLEDCRRDTCWTWELQGHTCLQNCYVPRGGRESMALWCRSNVSFSCLIDSSAHIHCDSRNPVSWLVEETSVNGGGFLFNVNKNLSKMRTLQDSPEWTCTKALGKARQRSVQLLSLAY